MYVHNSVLYTCTFELVNLVNYVKSNNGSHRYKDMGGGNGMAGVAFAIPLLWSLSNAIPHPESYLLTYNLLTMALQDRCFCTDQSTHRLYTLKLVRQLDRADNKSNNSAQLFIVRMRTSTESILVILSTILATPLL